MNEYIFKHQKDTLSVNTTAKIESEDPPTACLFMSHERNEDLVLVSNYGFKMKLWNVVNPERICRLTSLG